MRRASWGQRRFAMPRLMKSTTKVPQSNLIALVKFKFGRMLVFGFFSNSFVTCHKEIGFFFSSVCRSESLRQRIVLFVALSHCNKQIFVCCTESLWQTKFVYVLGKKPKKALKMLHFLLLFALFATFCYILAFCVPFFVFFSKNSTHFGSLCVINTNFVCCSDSERQTKNPFVAVTQCDKQNKSLSQWLSATNNTQNNIQFICGMWQKMEKKPKTNMLSNLNFTTAIKLLWGTLTKSICILACQGNKENCVRPI